jgi:hypothetical protein
MAWTDWLNVGLKALKCVPGIGNIVSAVDTVASVAEAIGGETGEKIAQGVNLVREGLEEADQQPMTPEQQVRLREAGLQHEERMRELDLADTQGCRALAGKELASTDEYVRRTRPALLRMYGRGSFLLVFLAVAVSLAGAFTTAVDKDEAAFIVDVLKWALPTVSGTFLMMFRVYTGRRTQEKLADKGIVPEDTLDKLVKLSGRGR